jgi:hypothetical protein
MKKLLVIFPLFCASPVMANGFTNREIAFEVLNAADATQTCAYVSNGNAVEINPLLGKHPSCGTVIGIKAGLGILHWLLARHINQRNEHAAKQFQIVSLIFQGGVVGANLRFTF